MATYRILSLDGGGIRGLIITVILTRLEKAVPGWLDQVDLIAGTSTGGIIALGLAQGLSPETVQEFYYHKSPRIFDDSWIDDLTDLGRIAGADYSIEPLEQEMREIFGDILLKELNKRVLIPTFDLDNERADPSRRQWKPKFFHNFPGEDSDGAMKAYKVALYTVAAPTYFPSADGYIDGGVVANNPSMAALAETQDNRAQIEDRPAVGEILLLSIGSGDSLNYIEGAHHDWGYAQWAKPLVSVMIDGSMGVADYQCRQILGPHYQRVSPFLERPIGLDKWRMRDELLRIGEQTNLEETVAWLEDYWL